MRPWTVLILARITNVALGMLGVGVVLYVVLTVGEVLRRVLR